MAEGKTLSMPIEGVIREATRRLPQSPSPRSPVPDFPPRTPSEALRGFEFQASTCRFQQFQSSGVERSRLAVLPIAELLVARLLKVGDPRRRSHELEAREV